jgi:hypothetical protein
MIINGLYMPSMKLMMPGYGASGTGYADTYGIFNILKNQAEAYQEFANSTEESGTSGDAYNTFVDYIDLACQLDSDFNFPMTQKDVNTRNSNFTEPFANNTIHPSDAGYMQIADAEYRHFVANFCQG